LTNNWGPDLRQPQQQTEGEARLVAVLDDDKILLVARSVIEADSRAVRGTLNALGDEFLEVANLLSTAAGKVLVTGVGTSGAVAARGAHLLSVCGTPAFYLSPADGLHGGLGVLQPADLLIALSKGGGSTELNEFCSRAKSLCRAVIAITADPRSALAELADHVIVVPLDDDCDLGAVVATGSSLAVGAVLDSLCEICRISREYDWERLLFTHPSGAVGRDAEQSLKRLTQPRANE
jgi:D-arabinose 5-phosphate isomerase GutQ